MVARPAYPPSPPRGRTPGRSARHGPAPADRPPPGASARRARGRTPGSADMTGQLLRIDRHGCPGRRGSAAKATPPRPSAVIRAMTRARRTRRRVCHAVRHVVTPVRRRAPALPRPAARWTRRVGPAGAQPLSRHLPRRGARPDATRHPSTSWPCADWLERVPGLLLDGERPTATQLAARLGSFWLPEQTVVYVGRTSKSLARARRGADAHATRRPQAASRRPLAVDPARPGQGCASGGPRRRAPRSTRTGSRAPSPRTSMRPSRRCRSRSSVPCCPGPT